MAQESFSTNTKLCAMFGDIVGSRGIVDRRHLQNRVAAALDEINARFKTDIVAPFRIIAGDEVRGLLRSQARAYEVISCLEQSIRPQAMRFAVGVGEISTDISADINMVDGPALHRAAEAMAVLKNQKRSHGRTILFSSDDPELDRTLNALTFLIMSIKSGWSDRVRDRVKLIGSGLTTEQVAQHAGISQQAAARSLQNAKYYAVSEAESVICSLLGQ